ncbi:TonB family protein [Acidobacteria bacterium AB60]|nr:TonB family protein [Acidobacteria bacterium AB60]
MPSPRPPWLPQALVLAEPVHPRQSGEAGAARGGQLDRISGGGPSTPIGLTRVRLQAKMRNLPRPEVAFRRGRETRGGRSMQPGSKRSRSSVVLSVAAHLFVLSVVLFVSHRTFRVVAQHGGKDVFLGIELAGGSHHTRLLLPRSLQTVEARKAAKEPPEAKKPAAPVHRVPPVKSQGGTAADAHQASNGIGDAAQGNGADAQNADPAFPIFSPKPPVTDRALLPDSQREIVVDVNVNANGDVVGVNMVKSLGNALDQIVLTTVKTWRFHPAMVNGNPVASQAELIFPFNPSYPITAG